MCITTRTNQSTRCKLDMCSQLNQSSCFENLKTLNNGTTAGQFLPLESPQLNGNTWFWSQKTEEKSWLKDHTTLNQIFLIVLFFCFHWRFCHRLLIWNKVLWSHFWLVSTWPSSPFLQIFVFQKIAISSLNHVFRSLSSLLCWKDDWFCFTSSISWFSYLISVTILSQRSNLSSSHLFWPSSREFSLRTYTTWKDSLIVEFWSRNVLVIHMRNWNVIFVFFMRFCMLFKNVFCIIWSDLLQREHDFLVFFINLLTLSSSLA